MLSWNSQEVCLNFSHYITDLIMYSGSYIFWLCFCYSWLSFLSLVLKVLQLIVVFSSFTHIPSHAWSTLTLRSLCLQLHLLNGNSERIKAKFSYMKNVSKSLKKEKKRDLMQPLKKGLKKEKKLRSLIVNASSAFLGVFVASWRSQGNTILLR